MNRDDDGKFTGRQEDLQMSEEYTVEFGRAVEFSYDDGHHKAIAVRGW